LASNSSTRVVKAFVTLYTFNMKLNGLSLHTNFFEDYLSFMSEVLELEVLELTDTSLKFDLCGTWLEIKKKSSPVSEVDCQISFDLDRLEYEAIVKKINFFYYRKEISRFGLNRLDRQNCDLIDPDGRIWSFQSNLNEMMTANDILL
jgi:hypothetical protein